MDQFHKDGIVHERGILVAVHLTIVVLDQLLDELAILVEDLVAPSLPNLEAKRTPEYTASLSYTPTTKYFEDFTIAIDWDPTALHLRYQSTLERVCRSSSKVISV